MSEPTNREVAVLNVALELRPAERAAYLDEACAGDPALRQRVEDLLGAYAAAEGFLEAPPPGLGATGTVRVSAPLTEKPGDRIGHYKLLQQIGEGGCGVVYMAEQEEPVRRRVALKVIKLGMDTKQVIARFEAERQALALMDHPNIAKIFDAGVTSHSQLSTLNSQLPLGRPFFVMELVRGIKITDFCDENKASTEDRLKLFIQVCRAIQHAHQKGVIHRDIKPSNILVTINDGIPTPKVIDFGIAKATQGRLTDQTLFTAFEQFIGTPAYMSPEQAVLTSLDIDTRSDIYSLGVLLYELLTGKTPFDQQELLAAGLDEMRRTIREKEPPRPSTRLSAMAAEALTTTAKRCHTDAPKLLHAVQGDLDWIVMKCLEKDRARRYETANGVAMDITRHLNCEPVVARPPSSLYEFRKTVRRHKVGFAATAAVLAALAGGVAVSTLEAIRATRAQREQTRLRQIAQTKEKRSEQVAELLKDMLRGVNPSVALGRDATMLRGILDRTAERLGKDLKADPGVEAEMRSIVGNTYQGLGDYEKAEAMHREALRLRRALFGETNEFVAASLSDLADAVRNGPNSDKAETMQREALATRRTLFGKEHPDVAKSLASLADTLTGNGKLTEAEALQRETLTMQRKLLGKENPDVAESLNNLSCVLLLEGKFAEAEAAAREALAVGKKLPGNENPSLATALGRLAGALLKQGKVAEAEPLFREALAMQTKVLGVDHPYVKNAQTLLVNVLRQEGKLGEAETSFSEVREARPVDNHARQGKWREALADATMLVEIAPGEHWYCHMRAPLQVQLGDLEGYRQGCAQELSRFAGTSDPYTAERMAKDCLILPDSGVDLSAVGAWADTAVAAGKLSPDLPWFQCCKGLAEYRQGHLAAAVDWMQKVLSHADGFNRDAAAYFVMAMAQYRSKQADEARAALARGVAIVEGKLPKLDSGDLGHWIDWIIAHALMREAKELIEGQTNTTAEKKPGPH